MLCLTSHSRRTVRRSCCYLLLGACVLCFTRGRAEQPIDASEVNDEAPVLSPRFKALPAQPDTRVPSTEEGLLHPKVIERDGESPPETGTGNGSQTTVEPTESPYPSTEDRVSRTPPHNQGTTQSRAPTPPPVPAFKELPGESPSDNQQGPEFALEDDISPKTSKQSSYGRRWQISVLGATPLYVDNNYESTFLSFGGDILLSLPIYVPYAPYVSL